MLVGVVLGAIIFSLLVVVSVFLMFGWMERGACEHLVPIQYGLLAISLLDNKQNTEFAIEQ